MTKALYALFCGFADLIHTSSVSPNDTSALEYSQTFSAVVTKVLPVPSSFSLSYKYGKVNIVHYIYENNSA